MRGGGVLFYQNLPHSFSVLLRLAAKSESGTILRIVSTRNDKTEEHGVHTRALTLNMCIHLIYHMFEIHTQHRSHSRTMQAISSLDS